MTNTDDTRNIYHKFKNEYLKEHIQEDFDKYPFTHTNVSDLKIAASFVDREEERKLFKLFALIKELNSPQDLPLRKNLIKRYYNALDRKYNDQSVEPDMPKPEKVGYGIDLIVQHGIAQIGQWACGVSHQIYPWMVAGSSQVAPTYGDTMQSVSEITRVNVINDNGFLDPMNDGWNASGGFVRTSPGGLVTEVAMANTNNYNTSKIFDRTLLPIADRILHEQNEDSYTLSAFYILTSI